MVCKSYRVHRVGDPINFFFHDGNQSMRRYRVTNEAIKAFSQRFRGIGGSTHAPSGNAQSPQFGVVNIDCRHSFSKEAKAQNQIRTLGFQGYWGRDGTASKWIGVCSIPVHSGGQNHCTPHVCVQRLGSAPHPYLRISPYIVINGGHTPVVEFARFQRRQGMKARTRYRCKSLSHVHYSRRPLGHS